MKYISFVLLASFAAVLLAQEAPQLTISADQFSRSLDGQVTTASGQVEVNYGATRLVCEDATVRATDPPDGWQATDDFADLLQYTNISFGKFHLTSPVWSIGGESGAVAPGEDAHFAQAFMTTCDHEEPHYAIYAKQIDYHPEDRTFTAHHVTLRFFDVPILYLPVLYGSTENSTGIIIRPGYSGKRGAYLRLGRAWQHGRDGSTQLFTDLMTKRGLALGEETRYQTDRRTIDTDLYALHDKRTSETEHGWDRRFKSRDDRFRVHAYWREQFDENWSLRLNLDYLSDISMLDDWFRHDWRHWGQPKSYASLDYQNAWLQGTLDFRPRINTFYTVSEKLPELRLEVPRVAPAEALPLIYSSSNTAGFYSMKWRNNERPRSTWLDPLEFNPELYGDPNDYSAFRADTLHTLQLPIDLGEAFTLTPRASFRATAYSRTSRRGLSEEELANLVDADNPDKPRNFATVSNYDRRGGSRTRFAYELGVEGRTKLLSEWSDAKVEWLGIDGLQHVVEPYFNYTWSPTPTVKREHLYFFDETDRLEYQNFLRLGLDQHWRTREASGASRTLLSLESYLDIHHREGEYSGRHWGDWGNRLTFQPRNDLRLWSTALYDIGEGQIHRGEVGVRYGREDDWSFSGRYIYRNDHLSRSAYSMGSTLADFTGESGYLKKHFETADTISGTLNIPLNSRTSFEIHAEYDFEHDRMVEHTYTLTRQLHCWTFVGGFGWDYNDFEIMLMLRLTAFPNVKLGVNI